MGKASRDKGARFERSIVKLLTSMGFPAERTPLSGAVKGSFSDDVIAEINGDTWRFELKKRANGFKQLYAWLEPESTDALIIAADRKEPLIVMPLSELKRIRPTADREFFDEKIAKGIFKEPCENCGSTETRLMSKKWDSYYCPACGAWSEPPCSDSNCEFCQNRPEKALTLGVGNDA